MPALKRRDKPASEFIALYHEIVRAREGRIAAGATRWSAESNRLRFRMFIRALRRERDHPLHEIAKSHEWGVAISSTGDVVVRARPIKRTLIR